MFPERIWTAVHSAGSEGVMIQRFTEDEWYPFLIPIHDDLCKDYEIDSAHPACVAYMDLYEKFNNAHRVLLGVLRRNEK